MSDASLRARKLAQNAYAQAFKASKKKGAFYGIRSYVVKTISKLLLGDEDEEDGEAIMLSKRTVPNNSRTGQVVMSDPFIFESDTRFVNYSCTTRARGLVIAEVDQPKKLMLVNKNHFDSIIKLLTAAEAVIKHSVSLMGVEVKEEEADTNSKVAVPEELPKEKAVDEEPERSEAAPERESNQANPPEDVN